MTLDRAEDILDAAADLLEKDGWCRRDLGNYQGQHCAVGAVLNVAGLWSYDSRWEPGANRAAMLQLSNGNSLQDTPIPAGQALRALALRINPDLDRGSWPWATIASWNNNDAEGDIEVVETMRKTAAELRAERPLGEL